MHKRKYSNKNNILMLVNNNYATNNAIDIFSGCFKPTLFLIQLLYN